MRSAFPSPASGRSSEGLGFRVEDLVAQGSVELGLDASSGAGSGYQELSAPAISWRDIAKLRADTPQNGSARPSFSRGLLGGWDAEDVDAKVTRQATAWRSQQRQLQRFAARDAREVRKKEASFLAQTVSDRLHASRSSPRRSRAEITELGASSLDVQRSMLTSSDHRQADERQELEEQNVYEHVGARGLDYRHQVGKKSPRNAAKCTETAPKADLFRNKDGGGMLFDAHDGDSQLRELRKLSKGSSAARPVPGSSVSSAYVHASTQIMRRDNRPASLQLNSVMRLTNADQGAVDVMEAAWESRFEEERLERAKKRDLLARRAERVLALILTQAARDAEAAEASEAARLEEMLAAERDRAKRYRKGVYGVVQVWVEAIPPRPPPLDPLHGKRRARAKTFLELDAGHSSDTTQAGGKAQEGLSVERLLQHPENSDDFEIFSDDDNDDNDDSNNVEGCVEVAGGEGGDGKTGLRVPGVSRATPSRRSIYTEDTDYAYFFLKPPPQMTVRIPKSFTPPSQVPAEDLPDLRRPRPLNHERKKAICLSFRATGLPLDRAGNLLPEDAEGVKAALYRFLSWARFNMLRYEKGLEVRSTRPLCSSDFEVYMSRRIKQDRVKVGVLIWVLTKQASRAAQTLARVAHDGLLAEELARQCPSLAFANGETVIRPHVGPVSVPMLEDGVTSPAEASDSRITAAEIDRYSVMSPASSKALWTLSVRIEAGLEISDGLLAEARSDLETRSKQFTCTNLGFERDRKRTQDAFANFKSDVGAWRSTLYRALLETEFGQAAD